MVCLKNGSNMDLSALADFNLVAAHGGFGKASRSSGRPKATLSRRVMDLEQSLGVRLLERGARSLRLTEEGQALHERTCGPLGEIIEAGESVAAGLSAPRGRLRVSAPVLFSSTLLGRIAAGFAQAYPEVRLDVVAEDRNIDLVDDGYDVAIRVNPRPDAALVGRCFARDDMLLVAPPALARPAAAADGQAPTVPAVALANVFDSGAWHYQDGDTLNTVMPDVRLRLSSLLMIRDAVQAGAGAALIPRSLLAQGGAHASLAVWGRIPDRPVELWVLHNSRRLVSTKVAAFVEYLCAAFPARTLTGRAAA
ncbi:LysR family transcriptional regulator [Bordetella parapertussis]|uniref:LysR-family transcriptional regulator n=3 Tax=Bordetella TaxID=517 RepID=A0A0H3LTC8_BORBR|nr:MULTISPECIES: LysR family transcriptional regulator [Bordetella]AMG88004.1 LysR family transcriptional regulator [Bordetella bronchiseptica]AOB39336.1 LysR family transcriptional regulator [Bordetella parapertussis]AUL43333.1 LysR family transcriptional regulator [Bordetella parapertussis]AWP63150.1 LysR family transcriptional regulator [Bordetella parapertussis]AWP70647.1 LysR family transcriptional regulator [Bordetella parapertussis]